MREFELYLPLTYNDGSPVEDRKIEQVGKEMLDFFDGMTYFPQSNQGYWKMGGVTFRDDIVIFRVLTDKPRLARAFFRRLKAKLKKSLGQEEILIVERDVRIL